MLHGGLFLWNQGFVIKYLDTLKHKPKHLLIEYNVILARTIKRLKIDFSGKINWYYREYRPTRDIITQDRLGYSRFY